MQYRRIPARCLISMPQAAAGLFIEACRARPQGPDAPLSGQSRQAALNRQAGVHIGIQAQSGSIDAIHLEQNCVDRDVQARLYRPASRRAPPVDRICGSRRWKTGSTPGSSSGSGGRIAGRGPRRDMAIASTALQARGFYGRAGSPDRSPACLWRHRGGGEKSTASPSSASGARTVVLWDMGRYGTVLGPLWAVNDDEARCIPRLPRDVAGGCLPPSVKRADAAVTEFQIDLIPNHRRDHRRRVWRMSAPAGRLTAKAESAIKLPCALTTDGFHD